MPMDRIIFYGLLCIIGVAALGAIRTTMSGGVSSTLTSLFTSLYVGDININYMYNTFPGKVDFQYGYTYLINFLMLLPGPDLDFTLWLKEQVGITFSGGGLTPTIIGEFYINFGEISIFIGLFLLGAFSVYLNRYFKRHTGKLGVVITTSGPGFTNALTGLANAWFDSVPVMLISGQVNTKDKRRSYTFRQFGFQEIQAIPMADPIVKKAYDVDTDTDVVAMLDEAYKIAFSDRKGSVYLDFPINIGRDIVEVEDEIKPVELESPAPFDASSYIDQIMADGEPFLIEAEFEDCSMLPNIHGGLDPLTNGPELPEGLADKIREIMERV